MGLWRLGSRSAKVDGGKREKMREPEEREWVTGKEKENKIMRVKCEHKIKY